MSHQFQDLSVNIVHNRLSRAAFLDERKLILECYHPSAQYTEPYLYCDYLRTQGLSDEVQGQGKLHQVSSEPGGRSPLQMLYSHFRPTQKDPEPNVVRSHPAGDIPGSRTSEAANTRRTKREDEVIKRSISLEAHELFSQLCFSANLVQMGPRRGVFISSIDAVETKTIRIWRQWLAERSRSMGEREMKASKTHLSQHVDEIDHNGNDDCDLDQLVWVDQNKIAGLKLGIREKNRRRDTPILIYQDEDQAVSYSIELQGSCFIRRFPKTKLTTNRSGHQHCSLDACCRTILTR